MKSEVILNVSGMSCGGCADTVKSALSDLIGVDQVSVDLEEDEVTVKFKDDKVSIEDMEEAIQSSGYTFGGVKEQTQGPS